MIWSLVLRSFCLTLILGLLLILAPPAYSQTVGGLPPVPTPLPAQPSPTPLPAQPSAGQLGQAADAFERGADVLVDASNQVGANTVLTFLVIGIMAMFVILVISPLVKNSARTGQDLSDAQRENTRARERMADTNEKLLKYLETNDQVVERNTKAYESFAGSQNNVAQAITANTNILKEVNISSTTILRQMRERDERDKARDEMNDEQHRKVNQRLDNIALLLTAMLMDTPDQKERIAGILREVNAAKVDTGKLDPDKVPDQPPSPPQ